MSTGIQWTATVHPDGSVTPGETWNPIRATHEGRTGWACVKVSPGCANCYAETQNKAGARDEYGRFNSAARIRQFPGGAS